jgi:hypothetical protein
MVKVLFSTEEIQLLASVIDNAQFSSTVAHADETYVGIQMLKSIKARLLAPIQPEDVVE